MSHKSEVQKQQLSEMNKVMAIFKNSDGLIRPHFILTGPSGSGKTNSIQIMCEELELSFIEINAALTMMELEGYIENLPGNIFRIKR